jgi:hypothetical protein
MSQFDDLKQEILYRLWTKGYEPGDHDIFTLDQLDKFLPTHLITPMSRRAIMQLNQDDFLETVDLGEYRISLKGIISIEEGFGVPGSDLSVIQNRLQGLVGTENKTAPVIPAADRFVTLDHNSDPYKVAVAALNDALAAFKEDHLLENEWGAEKAALLQTIEHGRELLKGAEAHVATIYATIVAPLRVLRERYEHAIVAGLITAGVDHLLPLCSKAVSTILSLIGMS